MVEIVEGVGERMSIRIGDSVEMRLHKGISSIYIV